jgi:hypothetical protein
MISGIDKMCFIFFFSFNQDASFWVLEIVYCTPQGLPLAPLSQSVQASAPVAMPDTCKLRNRPASANLPLPVGT